MNCFRSRQVAACYENRNYNKTGRLDLQNIPGVATETGDGQRRALRTNHDVPGKIDTEKSEQVGHRRFISPGNAVAALNRTSVARTTGASRWRASPGSYTQWNHQYDHDIFQRYERTHQQRRSNDGGEGEEEDREQTGRRLSQRATRKRQ